MVIMDSISVSRQREEYSTDQVEHMRESLCSFEEVTTTLNNGTEATPTKRTDGVLVILLQEDSAAHTNSAGVAKYTNA